MRQRRLARVIAKGVLDGTVIVGGISTVIELLDDIKDDWIKKCTTLLCLATS